MKNKNKNLMMIYLTSFTVLLSLMVHLIHRKFSFLADYTAQNGYGSFSPSIHILQNSLLIVPVILLVSVFAIYKKQPFHPSLQLLITLCLTFSSISIIAGSEGMTEYHFSIFMVLAMIAYFESINFILISTALFAIQHFTGFFLYPELLCGTADYHFSLLLVHAFFLIFSCLATVLLIHSGNKYAHAMEAQNRIHEKANRQLLDSLSLSSSRLLESVSQISVTSEVTSKSSKEIAVSIEEMNSGSDEQLGISTQNVHLLNSMLQKISQIRENSRLVKKTSLKTSEEAKAGRVKVNNMTGQMNVITRNMSTLTNSVSQLENRTQYIERALNTLSGISDQTNMLALNASIEAARAGSYGKGFSVVADEVRKLSLESDKAAKEIKEMISLIHSDMKEVKDDLAKGNSDLQTGISLILDTEQVFAQIAQAAGSTESQAEHADTVLQEMVSESKHVFESIEHGNHITRDALLKSSHITAAAQDQLNTVEALNTITGSLSSLSLQMNSIIEDINVRTEQEV
ncbi:methyl-accepting chemotaxis protein [Peribacillus sp. B-H-3]|uniref:methyl-accepting chemotaxis protein n=1 Tax=Peribacillus sp. B-H-3 TaxID=3400420 RepID=UPI003B018A94